MSRAAISRWAVGLSGVVFVAILAPLLSVTHVPVARDLVPFQLPLRHFVGRHLAALDVPLWNPWLFLGEPFVPTFQPAVFYPPSFILALSFPWGFNAFVLFHFALAAVGTLGFLRALGRSWPASALGAIVGVLSGPIVSLVGLTSLLLGFAWIPSVAWIVALLRTRVSRGRVLTLAGILTLQILAGSVESIVFSAVVGLTVLVSSPERASRVLRTAGALAVGALAAVGVTAFQLLPTWSYLGETVRSTALPEAQALHWSLDPRDLIDLVLPNQGGGRFLDSLHVGVVGMAMAFVGAVRRDGWLWFAFLIGAVALAMGPATLALPFLRESAPAIFGNFRYPEKFLLLLPIGLAVLSSGGLETLARSRTALPFLPLALIGLVAVELWAAPKPALRTEAWSVFTRAQPIIDPASLRSSGGRVFHYGPPPGATGLAASPTASDGAVWRGLYAATPLFHRIPAVGGAGGAMPLHARRLLDAPGGRARDDAFRLLRAANVHAFVGPDPRVSPLITAMDSRTTHPFHVAILRDPVPTTRLVTRTRLAATLKETFDMMAREDFDPLTEVVVATVPTGVELAEGEPGTATVLSWGADRREMETRCPAPRMLLTGIVNFPGWSATIDGNPAPIFRANGLFQGIVVPAGTSRVVVSYWPKGMTVGLAISAATLAVVVIALAAPRLRRHRPAPN